MTPHHSHVYRNQKEADRIIEQFGRKPSETVKHKIRESLLQERENFLAQAQVKHQARQRGRADGRER